MQLVALGALAVVPPRPERLALVEARCKVLEHLNVTSQPGAGGGEGVAGGEVADGGWKERGGGSGRVGGKRGDRVGEGKPGGRVE